MSFLQLLAAEQNVSPEFRALFCAETHTKPQPSTTKHCVAMAKIAEAIEAVKACDTPRFDCSEVLELLGDARILLQGVYFDGGNE